MQPGHQNVIQATVVSYEPNKTLVVKGRGRVGRHQYNLAQTAANITGNIGPGTMVKITETVDANGHHRITVEPVSGTSNPSRH